jgi:hypothetical protein
MSEPILLNNDALMNFVVVTGPECFDEELADRCLGEGGTAVDTHESKVEELQLWVNLIEWVC